MTISELSVKHAKNKTVKKLFYLLPLRKLDISSKNKMNIKTILFLTIFLIISSWTNAQILIKKSEKIVNINGKEYYLHTVEKGQTLFSISKTYNVDVRDIYEANPELENTLSSGQKIYIPTHRIHSIQFGSESNNLHKHQVAKGETLYGLAKKYNISIEAIRAANTGLEDGLIEGMEIIIPDFESTNKKTEPQTKTYENGGQGKPEKGYFEFQERNHETIYELAIRYRVSVDSILFLNPGLGEQLSKGEIIKIPNNPTKKGFITHNIAQRITINRLARNYGLSQEEIQKANPYISRQLQPGQTIKIPLPPLKNIESEITPPPEIYTIEENKKPYTPPVTSKDLCAQIPAAQTFDIALLIPLYFDELVEKTITTPSTSKQDKIPNSKSFQFIKFYEGFRLAVDSLEKVGLEARIHVFNVEEDVSQAQQCLKNPALKKMDLIVGPFFNSSFRIVAEFALKHKIPIINPLSAKSDVINDNPFVIKVIPNEKRIYNTIAEFISYKLSDSKIFIARQSKMRDEEHIINLRSALFENLENRWQQIVEFNIQNDSLSVFNREALKERPNVIIVYSENKVVILDLLRKLNLIRNRYDITVIGLPDWLEMEGLDFNHLGNLNTHFPAAEFADYHSEEVKKFVRRFREYYFTDPDAYAFKGFDTGIFFLSALMNFGSNFMTCLPYHDIPLLYSNYKFITDNENGFENQSWKILRLSNYRLYEVPVPVRR